MCDSVEPFLYKGHLRDFPLTMACGRTIDDLRPRYKAYVWDGTFRDTLGAEVSADGQHLYSVFVAENGKWAVVVINPSSGAVISAKVTLPNPGSLIEATPEDPAGKSSNGTLQLPARSAAVLIELRKSSLNSRYRQAAGMKTSNEPTCADIK